MSFRFSLKLCIAALSVGACLYAIESYDDYVAAMKTIAGANGAIRKNLEGDLPAVAKAAEELKTAMGEVEQYWEAKGVADAQQFAHDAQHAAEAVHAAAMAGDAAAATTAAKSIGATCQGCHQAHRDKGEDGKFIIK